MPRLWWGGCSIGPPPILKTPSFGGCHAKKKRIKLIKVSRGKKLIRQKHFLYRCEARPLKFGAGAPSQLLWLGSVPDSVPATPWLLGTQLLLRRVPKWLPRSRPSTAMILVAIPRRSGARHPPERQEATQHQKKQEQMLSSPHNYTRDIFSEG